jgi:hypothetical protein
VGVEIEKGAWHLDKRVSIVNIFTFTSAMIGITLYLADTRSEVAVLQKDVSHNAGSIIEIKDNQQSLKMEIIEKIDRLDEAQRSSNRRLEGKIDKLIDRELNAR